MKFICEECEKPCILDSGDYPDLTVADLVCVVKNSCYCKWKKYENGEVAKLQPKVAKLPKLTSEVFNRPDCPDEATFAIVYQNGSAAFMRGNCYDIRPVGKGWEYSRSSGVYQLCEIPGNWDASNWQNSLVERQAAKLPYWCKVGEWFWHPEDMAGGRYLKITEIRGGGVYAKEKEDYDPDYLCFDFVRKYSQQARLRPYGEEEMKALLGKAIERYSSAYLVISYAHDDLETTVYIEGKYLSANNLLRDFTINGKPCGVLEHLDKGEWVK